MESQDRDSTMRSKKNNDEMNTVKVLTHETYDPYLVNNC